MIDCDISETAEGYDFKPGRLQKLITKVGHLSSLVDSANGCGVTEIDPLEKRSVHHSEQRSTAVSQKPLRVTARN